MLYEDYTETVLEEGKERVASFQICNKIFNGFNIGFHKLKSL